MTGPKVAAKLHSAEGRDWPELHRLGFPPAVTLPTQSRPGRVQNRGEACWQTGAAEVVVQCRQNNMTFFEWSYRSTRLFLHPFFAEKSIKCFEECSSGNAVASLLASKHRHGGLR